MPVRALRARLSGDVRALGPALDDARWRRIVAALERDGLIHLIGGEVRLGAATIDP
jgi:hypothetical protein